MSDNENMLNISIGILTWKRLDILRQTLDSYKKGGLLDLTDDITVFFNEIGEEEIALAKEYNLKCIGDKENIGIKNAYKTLVDNAKHEYFLFLENDWYLIENPDTVKKRLVASMKLLAENAADVIRFRHRIYPGLPCGIAYKNIKHPERTPKYDLAFVPNISKNPCALFEEISEKKIGDDTYYFVGPKNTYWTNNPCLLKTSVVKGIINLDLPAPKDAQNKKNKTYRTSEINVALEEVMKAYWPTTDYITALSPGLFTHLDYIENFKPHRRYPAILIKFASAFIRNAKKRREFRARYSLPKAFYDQ